MISRRVFMQAMGWTGAALAGRAGAEPPKRPNILWLSCEDIGPHLGCYGYAGAHTPNLDRLATQGVRYANAFTTAGVCAPTRSGIITGVYASTLGTQHMRSGGEGVRRSIKPELPAPLRCFPAYLRDQGYYCTNNSKQDYNFATPAGVWDESSRKAHWRNRSKPNQPFFAVFNFTGSHEGSISKAARDWPKSAGSLRPEQRQDPGTQRVPPFHPDTPAVRQAWAGYQECITRLDHWIQERLDELEEVGLAEDTIVMFWADHGQGMPRCKRWLYDSGTHVPLIVRMPRRFRTADQGQPGTVEQRLVSSLDLGPTALSLAGLPIPETMQGKAFLGNEAAPPRDYVFAARDRMDERYDIIRTVRDKRFRYIRNYMPFKPYDQFMNTAEKSPVKIAMRRLEAEKALPPGAQWIVRDRKPAEELYDTQSDPHEMNNLAADPAHKAVLERMRAVHERWMRETNDLGLFPEPELARLGQKCGSRYAIWPTLDEEDPGLRQRLRAAAVTAGRMAPACAEALVQALDDPQPAVRFWGATGLAYCGPPTAEARLALARSLEDEAATVRVAAAQALAAHDVDVETALAVLTAEAASEAEWVRLQAVTALDALGETARPAVPVLEQALGDKDNKYVVRVANRALNVLLGTDNEVR